MNGSADYSPRSRRDRGNLSGQFPRTSTNACGSPAASTARSRRASAIWKTETGKANFIVPKSLEADLGIAEKEPDVLRLMTVRSNDQFNTTVYGYHDRFRGVKGTRMVLFMNRSDIAA